MVPLIKAPLELKKKKIKKTPLILNFWKGNSKDKLTDSEMKME